MLSEQLSEMLLFRAQNTLSLPLILEIQIYVNEPGELHFLLCAYESHWNCLDCASIVLHSDGIVFFLHIWQKKLLYILYMMALTNLSHLQKKNRKQEKVLYCYLIIWEFEISMGFSVHSLNSNTIIITSSLLFGYGILVCLSKRLFFSMILFILPATR